MPVIRVSMWTGRTHEQKQALAKALTSAMVEAGRTKPEAVTIIFEEIEKENWASAGTLDSAAKSVDELVVWGVGSRNGLCNLLD